MKILHTADWHLGKRLGQYSRLAEQRLVLEELVAHAEQEQPDVVLLAGDVFDNPNPSDEANLLYAEAVTRLARGGACPVVVIAGNHDSADGIESVHPFALANGVLVAGYPLSEIGVYNNAYFEVSKTDRGFIEISFLQKNLPPLRLIHCAYTNELRLKTYLGRHNPEEVLRDILTAHWGDLAAKYCDDKGVNVLVSHHFFMTEGETPEAEDDDERPILRDTVGGAQAIYTACIPEAIQYAALGHLHSAHAVKGAKGAVWYSGSILQYSLSEAGQDKAILIVDIEPAKTLELRKVKLSAGKRLYREQFTTIAEAVEWLVAHQDTYVEITLVSDTAYSPSETQALYDVHNGILHPLRLLTTADGDGTSGRKVIDFNQNIEVLFKDYFESKHNGQTPSDNLMTLFREVLDA